jgi:hypothetical protein
VQSEACLSEKTNLLFATRHLPFTVRHSLFANRCRFGSAGASPSHFSRPSSHSKSALNFCIINYGLKSVAWFAPSTIHATGFSQWLMTSFF